MRFPVRQTLLGAFTAALLAATAGGGWVAFHNPRPAVPEAAEEVLPLPPEPPRLADNPEYEDCLARLRDDAQGALSFAEGWEARGGGDGARHCSALALLALGEPERAGARLEAVASHSSAGPGARAAVLGQAGQAWMAAGQPARAFAAITLALVLAPTDADLLIDRAIAAGALGRYADALADVDHAIEQDANRPEAWVFRAAALRHLDRPQEALRDIERALALNPDNAEALLERGILRQLQGDAEGARQDWERTISLSPDSAAADLAEQNLALNAAGPSRR